MVKLLLASSIRRVLTLSFAVAMFGASTDTASASLLGDLVHGEMLFKDFPGLGNMFDTAPKAGCPQCTVPSFPGSSGIQPLAVVLDPDIVFPEFVFRDTGFLDVTADIDSSTIDVAVINTSGSLATEAPYGWEIRITGMDWINGPPGVLTSAKCRRRHAVPRSNGQRDRQRNGHIDRFSWSRHEYPRHRSGEPRPRGARRVQRQLATLRDHLVYRPAHSRASDLRAVRGERCF